MATQLGHTPASTSLNRLLAPKSIALVGAKEKSIWSVAAYDNLVRFGYAGRIIPVHPRGGTIHGLAAATSCVDAGEPIDAALIMVPEAALLETIADLKAAGVAGAVILSSGFAETGHDGAERQAAIAAAAREAGIRLIGPNCLGFANFVEATPIWTTPLRRPMPDPRLALVSQSGALASHMEQFAYQQRVAITHMISTGNEADVTVADAIDYLVDCDQVKSIALFLETVRNPARFEAAVGKARDAGKPVVLLKVGASEAAAAAAQAHTGSLVGNDRVFEALCRRLGMIRVQSLEEVIVTADLAGRIGRLSKPGFGMAAMSGGLCEIAVDQAEADGVSIPVLTEATLDALKAKLPSYATPNNPLDLTGAAMLEPALISQSLETLAEDPGIGLVAFVFEAPPKDDARGFASSFLRAIGAGLARAKVPGLLISPTVTQVTGEARAMTEGNGIPYTGGGLRNALAAIGHLLRWSALPPAPAARDIPPADCRPETERAVLDYLAARGVGVVPGPVATSAEDAVRIARSFPEAAVLKIASADIQHKTEVGGVALNLADDDAVRGAFTRILESVRAAKPDAAIDGVIVSPMRAKGLELFVGTMRDPQWGPSIAVGLGGVFVEVLKDTSLRLLPITEDDALEMLGELRGSALLDGFRGGPAVDRTALARQIVAIGDAALALGPDLVSLEINPLLASGDRIEALDGLAVWGNEDANA